MRRGVFGDGLRHAAHAQILAIAFQHGRMQRAKGLSRIETFPRESNGHIVTQRPAEFLEIHGEHFDPLFLRRNQYVGSGRLQRHKRTRLDVIVSPVGDKMLNHLPRLWTQLHLVEHDQALAREELRPVFQGKRSKEPVQIMRSVKNRGERIWLRT